MLQPDPGQTTLHYASGLEIVIIAGSLGGLVSAIGALIEGGVEKGHYIAARGVPVWLFLFGRCVVGIGGATAVILAALSVNKFTGSTDIDLLALTALCFVAGSIGYRLLPIVAAQLERRLGEVEKKAERADKAAKQGSELAAVTSNVLIALQVLDRPEELSTIVDQAISQLETLSHQFPRERALHIVLGRLYAEKKRDYDSAIAVLRRFVKSKGAEKDKDVSDADFNIACYISRKLEKESNENKRGELEEEGITALTESLRIVPDSLNDAKNDPDLAALRATAGGRKLFPEP